MMPEAYKVRLKTVFIPQLKNCFQNSILLKLISITEYLIISIPALLVHRVPLLSIMMA
jgi:hypothetical protein